LTQDLASPLVDRRCLEYFSIVSVLLTSVGHPMAVESPDQGLADSGKDSPIPTDDSGKIYSSPQEDVPAPLSGDRETQTKTVKSDRIRRPTACTTLRNY